jgi:sigma-B regulation protein RsbU (phosphoserine phosphatase)
MAILRNLSIKRKLLLGIFVVSLVSIIIDAQLTYESEKADILEGIDAKLKAAAYGIAHIVSPQFHAKIEDQHSVSSEEHLSNVKTLAQFALHTGLEYACTYMMFDDTVVFTSTSESAKDIEEGNVTPFLLSYNTASDSLRKSLIDGLIRFATYTDEYGSYRSVFIPFTTENGKIFVAEASISLRSLEERLWKVAVSDVLFEVLVFLTLLIGVYVIVGRTTRPLSELTGHTTMLVEQNFKWSDSVRETIKSISESKRDEVGRLAEALLQMERMLQTYIKNLAETTAAKERIESELSIARSIQMGFLPQVFPAFPDRTEFDLHAIIEPAKEVGGDLYDYFMIDDHHLFLLIGDVSDKGVPAALFMAVTKTLFGTQASQADRTISEVMRQVNKDLSRGNPWQMFVTAFAGVLDIGTGEIQYCDAGHEPPFIIRHGKEVELVKKRAGAALCFFDDCSYELGRMQLHPGDALILYTDGVTEAMNKERKMFRREGITEALRGYSSIITPAATISQTLLDHVRSFADNEPQSDDITILVVRYNDMDAGKA